MTTYGELLAREREARKAAEYRASVADTVAAQLQGQIADLTIRAEDAKRERDEAREQRDLVKDAYNEIIGLRLHARVKALTGLLARARKLTRNTFPGGGTITSEIDAFLASSDAAPLSVTIPPLSDEQRAAFDNDIRTYFDPSPLPQLED